ncbi:hypothetical protein SAMN06295912_11867 [Sphingomonas laterariae]|uniref:Uncharacterized protein n=1 Tax=Edaphosphingomonas laterariae TaxID=861865 RepID=A0A239HQL2_9SPHN|nr:hypothetical protein SAMN06295912_11867 [Sphingomonas laterariae]
MPPRAYRAICMPARRRSALDAIRPCVHPPTPRPWAHAGPARGCTHAAPPGQCAVMDGGRAPPGQCAVMNGCRAPPGQCAAMDGGRTPPGRCAVMDGGRAPSHHRARIRQWGPALPPTPIAPDVRSPLAGWRGRACPGVWRRMAGLASAPQPLPPGRSVSGRWPWVDAMRHAVGRGSVPVRARFACPVIRAWRNEPWSRGSAMRSSEENG